MRRFLPMRHLLGLCVLVLLVGGCGSNGGSSEEGTDEPVDDGPLEVTVQWTETRQPVHGFGASDAWSTQFVGKNWPVEKRNQIADWLFSRDTTDGGAPEGIGLSIWRFNIGGGSAEQGQASGIEDPWRRAEGFLQDDGAYDWSRQQGQQWFLQAAQERGVSTFIGFVNSPPVEYTSNGRAYGDGSGTANLPDDRFDDFAQFLGEVAEHFENEGLAFDYLSPVNEPQWNWSQDNNQEGSPYTNAEIAQVTEQLNQELSSRGLSTEIEVPEAAQVNFLHSESSDYPDRSDQLASLFGDEGLGDLSHVAQKAAGHSYYTTWPIADLVEQREQLAEQMDATDSSMEYWMSEYCILADNREIEGAGRDRGMDPALYVARVVHMDLTVANASSWQWWLGVSPYDYKDGLVYIERDQDNGDLYDSKLLWGLGNYSRFLQPGSERVATERSDEAGPRETAQGLMVSAYRAADGERPVVVAVNQEQGERELNLGVEGRDVSMWRPYVTSSGN
ncbi:MAG: glycoside hydrolase, partial [Salinivenus sp.]